LGARDALTAPYTGGSPRIGAWETTNEQLEQAKSLEDATMPNGQKYEDWLKSKGREEDGENSGPS